MALFNFGKKDGLKKVSVCSCQCGASSTEAGEVQMLTRDVTVIHQRYSR